MQMRHRITGELFTLTRTETDGDYELQSPSGETVTQNVAAGTARMTNEAGATLVCSDPQLADEYEELTSG